MKYTGSQRAIDRSDRWAFFRATWPLWYVVFFVGLALAINALWGCKTQSPSDEAREIIRQHIEISLSPDSTLPCGCTFKHHYQNLHKPCERLGQHEAIYP